MNSTNTTTTNNDEQLLQWLLQSLKIPRTHLTVGWSNHVASQKHVRILLTHRRLPDTGWSDFEIQSFLLTLSTLDTNHKTPASTATTNARWCGVGEREGRVYSNLVLQRHLGFSHGVGRSGDITEPQPKAVGSSILAQLTLSLVLDAVRRGSGLDAKKSAAYGIVLPLCTGMSVSLALCSFRSNNEGRNIVLWCRIDQKSCFKAVTTAGFTCVVVPTVCNGDSVVTNVSALQEMLLHDYHDQVVAVITTTSCFAPRIPDKVDQVARLCHEHGVAHVINHAYGLQCRTTNQLLNRACTVGRVDAIVCSTDKNFLVPVGGAVILSPHSDVIKKIGTCYAGRASATPVWDLAVTLLSMGLHGYQTLLQQRQILWESFVSQWTIVAERHGERLLQCSSNTVSFAMTLDSLARPRRGEESEAEYLQSIQKDVSRLGAMLFSRCVSGTRVVPRGVLQSMGQHEFVGFGSSVDNYPHAYLTAACAIGVTKPEIEEFLKRLDKTLFEFKKKGAKPALKQF